MSGTHAQDALGAGIGCQHHAVQTLDQHALVQVRNGEAIARFALGQAALNGVFLNGDAGQVGYVVEKIQLFFARQAGLAIEQREHTQLVAA